MMYKIPAELLPFLPALRGAVEVDQMEKLVNDYIEMMKLPEGSDGYNPTLSVVGRRLIAQLDLLHELYDRHMLIKIEHCATCGHQLTPFDMACGYGRDYKGRPQCHPNKEGHPDCYSDALVQDTRIVSPPT